MGALKNTKHEHFVNLWHQGKSKAEAFLVSHPHTKKWKAETRQNKGYELSKRGDVLARFEELQAETSLTHGITVKGLLFELEEARQAALHAETPQASACVSATMSKAKLCGLDIIKVEVTEKEELIPWADFAVEIDN
jgi:hypothetical protein